MPKFADKLGEILEENEQGNDIANDFHYPHYYRL